MSIEDESKKIMEEIVAAIKDIRKRIAEAFAKHPATDNAMVKLDSAVNNLAAHPAASESSANAATDPKPAA